MRQACFVNENEIVKSSSLAATARPLSTGAFWGAGPAERRWICAPRPALGGGVAEADGVALAVDHHAEVGVLPGVAVERDARREIALRERRVDGHLEAHGGRASAADRAERRLVAARADGARVAAAVRAAAAADQRGDDDQQHDDADGAADRLLGLPDDA